MLESAFDSQLPVEEDHTDPSVENSADPSVENSADPSVDGDSERKSEVAAIGGDRLCGEAYATSNQDTASSERHTQERITDTASLSPDEEGSDRDEQLPELLNNCEIRPFRDQPDHLTNHRLRDMRRGEYADSLYSVSTTTSVAPEVIKERVKRQFKSEEKVKYARRIRKHGEAAVQTRKRRDNMYDVKTSLDAGWY